MYVNYDMKTLLEIIFKYTKKNARILADQYLLKDVSIISKWRNSVIYPKNDDIIKIVEFANTEATSSQKELIRDNIEELLRKAPIKSKIKDIIIDTKDFSEFLKEAISVAMPEYEEAKKTKSISSKESQVKGKEAYSGTVKLDFDLPEGDELNLQKLANGPGIKFNGILNLTPKKKKLKVANFFTSSTALGVLLVWVISGTIIIAFSGGMQKNDSDVFASKNSSLYSEPIENTNEPDILDTENIQEYTTPSPIPEIKEIDNSKTAIQEESEDSEDGKDSEEIKESKEKEVYTANNQTNNMNNNYEQNTTNNTNNSYEQNTTNNTNNSYEQNTTNNTQVNSWNNSNIQISGENHKVILGEQNAVIIETD
ncbi:hypothetical protein A7W90_11500 [Clostridium sp. Bc-iso-3]|nr:hypothetical protein A7W90_11500 [Clostridium sp. Bc-iso-3]